MEKKIFYRVGNKSGQGLWYDSDGNFTGLIHSKFNFCMNSELQMPYDPSIIGWISTTDNLDDLLNWFPIYDIIKLEEYGYRIVVYEATDYKIHENHWVIKQDTSTLKEIILVKDIENYNSKMELV